MAQYTQHYGLHQWEPGDSFLRTEFNEDLAKIDAALGGKLELEAGTYTGNGSTLRIELGYQPRMVLIPSGAYFCAVASPEGAGGSLLSVTETGFCVVYSSTSGVQTNQNGRSYCYLALR